ncbi:MAG: lactate utilization protein [Desulfobacteraceae bacterium]|jgi:L-lactate dehydrogenase complex protein LldG|nr:lactate utilization protein [Desulfobacteraceae bacterium]
MSEGSRDRIFSRLHAASRQTSTPDSQPSGLPIIESNHKEKIEKLKSLMEAMRTEVYIGSTKNWETNLSEILDQRNVKSLLYAPRTVIGQAIENHLKNYSGQALQLIPYENDIEQLKETVFNVDAGITSAVGAIAETGALILWPSEKEPRLMSIVPSIHIAVLKADTIHNTLLEAMQKENWSEKMPTNVVLVSGPSKTADIEMTLAFGVHGPKELIVLIVED